MKYIDFSVGTYTDDDTENMINFELEREEGVVKMRGPEVWHLNILQIWTIFDASWQYVLFCFIQLRKAEILNLNSGPYTWRSNDTNIVKIMEDDEGYILQSTFCDYRLQFRPEGPEPIVRLTAGEDYEDLVDGLCGNDDGDFYNDA